MKRLATLLVIVIGFIQIANAQPMLQRDIKIHEEVKLGAQEFEINSSDLALPSDDISTLNIKSFGFHVYWASKNSYLSYNYSALTHIGYFSLEVDTATGKISNSRGWESTAMVSYAHSKKVKISPVLTLFGAESNKAILKNPSKRDTLIDAVIKLIKQRGGDGVNIDFESVASAEKDDLVSFVSSLKTKLKAALPKTEISLCLPAVDWNNSFDVVKLSEHVDFFIMMGYDYYYSGSQNAGPVAPLYGGNYNIEKSVDSYLNKGLAKSKLLLGVPWYGYSWVTESSDKMSKTLESGKAVTYSDAKTLAASHPPQREDTYRVPWMSYNESGKWYQVWYDDSLSLSEKYLYAKNKGIGGIAVWALSYAGTLKEPFNGIISIFNEPGFVFDTKTDDYFYISNGKIILKKDEYNVESICIYDIMGNTFDNVSINFESINISNFPVGTYFIVVKLRELNYPLLKKVNINR